MIQLRFDVGQKCLDVIISLLLFRLVYEYNIEPYVYLRTVIRATKLSVIEIDNFIHMFWKLALIIDEGNYIGPVLGEVSGVWNVHHPCTIMPMDQISCSGNLSLR